MLLLVAVGLGSGIRALYRIYLSQSYGFHDLGLINDILASAPHHGRVFHVFDYDINHLSLHFTPSLVLWIPLYWLLSSQFLLLALNACALFGAVAVAVLILKRLLGQDASWMALAAAYAFLGVAVWRNTFFWNALTAAHYEEFYTFYAMGLLYLVLIEARLLWVVIAYVLCLGSRQDTGFFLFFQLGSLLLLPGAILPDRRALAKRLVPMMLIGPLYTVFIVKVVFPWYGVDQTWHAKRLWAPFGNSFEEIAINLLTHPGRLITEVVHSAAGAFNESFFFVQLLHPVIALVNNIPGILFYTTSTVERKYLFYYNASLLLPGMLFSVIVGIVYLRQLLLRCPWPRLVTGGGVFVTLMLALTGYASLAKPPGREYSTRPPTHRDRFADTRARQAFIAESLAACRVTTAAAGFHDLVLLPNRIGKYMPPKYRLADVVFAFPGSDPLYGDLSQLRDAVSQDADFRLVRKQGEHAMFAKRQIVCDQG